MIIANRVLIITVGVRKSTVNDWLYRWNEQVLVKETRLQQLIWDDVISTGQSGDPRQSLQKKLNNRIRCQTMILGFRLSFNLITFLSNLRFPQFILLVSRFQGQRSSAKYRSCFSYCAWSLNHLVYPLAGFFTHTVLYALSVYLQDKNDARLVFNSLNKNNIRFFFINKKH